MSSIHLRRLAGAVSRTTGRVLAEARRMSGGGFIDPDALEAMRLPWFTVRDDSGGGDTTTAGGATSGATVFIFDEIGGSLGIQASELVQDIENITADTITVRINSPGGSVFDAVAIYNALIHHPAQVVVYVDALAASAASVIAMAGNEVVMMPGSQMMIHDASAMIDGNEDEHNKMATFLGRQSDNIADIYRLRAGGTVDEWRALMLDETWAFAQEAVDLHLADRVQPAPAARRPVEDEADAEMMTRSFDLSHYRYAGRQVAPAPGTGRRKATMRVREPAPGASTRALAAAARKRAFTSGEKVTMPDRSSERSQTRNQALGQGDSRNLPFGATLRGVAEPRNGRDLYHVHGYATVFNKPYPMWDCFGEYEEVVVGGAADRTLMSDPDVSFLVNHGGVTMARTTNGTLTLSADAVGLIQDAWLNPNRDDVQIIMSAIDDGLITEMSFAFMIPDNGGWWSDDFDRFEIRQFDIDRGDVSAVNYGASPWTSIAARAREVMVHADLMPAGMQRAFAARLGGITSRQDRRAQAADLAPGLDTTPLSAPPIAIRPAVPRNEGRSLSVIEAMLSND